MAAFNEGVRSRKYRRALPGENLDINSSYDNKPIRLNSRDYSATSGSQIGVQIKPNIIGQNSSEHTGLEVSPRLTDVAGSLLGLNIAPLLKTATTGRAVATMKCLELNPGLPGSGSAYTVTQLDGIRVFLDTGVGHTITTASVIRIAAPNAADWNYLLNIESAGNLFVTATNAVIDHAIPIKVGSTNYWIGVYDATS